MSISLHHRFNGQLFDGDQLVFTYQPVGQFVTEIFTLIGYFEKGLLDGELLFLPPLGAFLSAGDGPLQNFESVEGLAQMPRVLYFRKSAIDVSLSKKVLHAPVHSDFALAVFPVR